MAAVVLTRDTIVRFSKGSVLEVSEAEAARLIAFGNAMMLPAKAAQDEKKPAKKKASAKK